MPDAQELISDYVMSTIESIEDSEDSARERLDNPLEWYVEASSDGTLREVYLVLTTGGPHIEVALSAGRVDGYWSSREHSAPVMENESILSELFDLYAHRWELTVGIPQ